MLTDADLSPRQKSHITLHFSERITKYEQTEKIKTAAGAGQAVGIRRRISETVPAGLWAVRRFGAIGILPYVFVWYAARGILTPEGGVPEGLARYGWYALIAAILSAGSYFAGLMCTHLAAFRVATNMRKMAVAHLVELPLGYFNANLTGRLRKQIDDNAAMTETLLAHTHSRRGGGNRNTGAGGGAPLCL